MLAKMTNDLLFAGNSDDMNAFCRSDQKKIRIKEIYRGWADSVQWIQDSFE